MTPALARVLVGAVLVATTQLAGCGGEGNGSGGGTGNTAGRGAQTTFVTTPTALAFSATQGGPVPASQSLHVHLNDTSLSCGSGWAGGPGPAWITEPTLGTIDFSSHPSDWNQVYQITTTSLPPGVYRATLEFRTSEPSASWPPPLVEFKQVAVTYTITAP